MCRKFIEYIFGLINPWQKYKFGKRRHFVDKLKEFLKMLYLWLHKSWSIRYFAALKELQGCLSENSSILEVGSGTLGLSRYTRRKIIGVDIKTIGPYYPNMNMVGASALFLPFKDQSFDFVVSLDMLEHIPCESREKVINELLRITKKGLIVGTPIFEMAKEIEARAKKVYESKIGHWKKSEESKKEFEKRNIFLSEHVKYGLPKEKEMRLYFDKYLKEYSGRYEIKAIDNESIFVWYYGVLGNMKYSYLKWFITAAFFVLFFGILSRIKLGGCYRKIFIIKKERP